jgi:beta-glucanase (GH16 family)
MKRIFFALAMSMFLCSGTFGQDWKLIWSEEFDYNGLPNESSWNYFEGMAFNNEKQHYRSERLENTRAEDGMLIIEAFSEKYQGANYTSGRIMTKGKKEFLYGRIEVRAKLPTGVGMWPAIWMLGSNIDDMPWPACGEIDIMKCGL